MTLTTTVSMTTAEPGAVHAVTAFTEDPSRAYCEVVVRPPRDRDQFERNAVEVEIGPHTGIEVSEGDTEITLRMRHADGRTLAQALTAFYAHVDEQAARAAERPINTDRSGTAAVGSTMIGEGLNHGDQRPHR